MQRFFLEQKLKAGEVVEMPQDIARQISAVLRMRAGEKIILFDGSGYDFTAELEAVSKNNCSVRIVSKTANDKEPKRRIILFQSLIKKDKMEWVAEKCTEIGVAEIVPVLAVRSVKTGLNMARMEKIAKEAAEQSGRAIVPMMRETMFFEEALRWAKYNCDEILFFHEKAERLMTEDDIKAKVIGVFVGPEGGFGEDEAKAADRIGAEVLSLSSRILRSETAAVCASYVLIK